MLSLRGQALCRSTASPTSCFTPFVSCKSVHYLDRRQRSNGCQQPSVRHASLGVSHSRLSLRCCAKPESEQYTPEVVEHDEVPSHLSLPAQQNADPKQLLSSSRPQQLASWALGHQHKGMTTLLGFAGVALAGIAGTQCRPMLLSIIATTG